MLLEDYADAVARAALLTAASVHADTLTLGKHAREAALAAAVDLGGVETTFWRFMFAWRPRAALGRAPPRGLVDNAHNLFCLKHPHAVLAYAHSYPHGPMRLDVMACAGALARARAHPRWVRARRRGRRPPARRARDVAVVLREVEARRWGPGPHARGVRARGVRRRRRRRGGRRRRRRGGGRRGGGRAGARAVRTPARAAGRGRPPSSCGG